MLFQQFEVAARRQDFAKVLPMQGVGLSSLRGMEQNQIRRTAPLVIEFLVHPVIHDSATPGKLTHSRFISLFFGLPGFLETPDFRLGEGENRIWGNASMAAPNRIMALS